MPRAIYCLPTPNFDLIFGPRERADLAALLGEPVPHVQPAALRDGGVEGLADVEMVFGGWSSPRFDAELLAKLPSLKTIFYAAGSVRGIVSEALWERGITICSSWAANGIPVAEYTLAQIIWCLKNGWACVRHLRQTRRWEKPVPQFGAYGSTVGIVSLGMIGRLVCERLSTLDVHVIAYDPFVPPERAAEMGVELVDLAHLFARSEVVSLHTPWLPETVGMITGELLGSMKPNATFINTARGAVVNHDEMIEVLHRRPDLTVVLDVTWPEPLPPDSPLWELPNAILTPHMAGSMGPECHRMARFMVEEAGRYLRGDELKWSVSRQMAQTMA